MATKKAATAKATVKSAEKSVTKKVSAKVAAPVVGAPEVAGEVTALRASKVEVNAAAVSEASAATSHVANVVKATPSRDAIAKRAFELFVARGGANGNAFEDWLRAEQELTVG